MAKNRSGKLDYYINLGLAAIVGLSGCVNFLLVLLALGIGLALDAILKTSPLFTIVFLIIGVPFALWLMIQMALQTAKKIEQRQYGNNQPPKQ